MSKRILIALLNDKVGGAEHVLKLIANYYLERDYVIDVKFVTKSIGNYWEEYLNNSKVNLIYTESEKESKGMVSFCCNIIKEKKYIYEFTFSSHIYLNFIMAQMRRFKFLNTKKLICRDSHSYYLVNSGRKLKLYDFLIKKGYGKYQDLIIEQTEEMQKQLLDNNEWLKYAISKVLVINNPVNLHEFEKVNEFKFERKTIVSAGRLIKIKGFDLLIKAFARLNRIDYDLVILGDGEERAALEDLIRSLNLSNNVHLIGFKPNVLEYFKGASICIVSSLKEGFPNVLLQMMSQNDNVISTLCAGGINEIKGLNLCLPNNIESIEEQLRYCMEENASTAQNRAFFEEELNKRSINLFVEKINDCTKL